MREPAPDSGQSRLVWGEGGWDHPLVVEREAAAVHLCKPLL